MEKIPYFKLTADLHEQLTILQILKYLRQYDDNLSNDKLVNTIKSAASAFKDIKVDDFMRVRQTGHGLVTNGYLNSAKLNDGFKAINRRGCFQIKGEAQVVDIPNLKNGKIVKSLQAPMLYTEGINQQIYVDFPNVGPLINQFAYGFDFSDYNKPSLIRRFKDFDEKIAFLNTIQNRVIYVLEQVTLEDNEHYEKYKYHPKHTVWLIFPDSLFLFLNSFETHVAGTERLVLCKNHS
ncbi:hypothetical protein ACFQ3S_10970 [Mucilaginibacter terrae]|uniref:hypothetical protein n=1 Tax=Mucilaginibacter terrae TaxID=1955052 RepID=UPI00363DE7C1